MILAKLTSGLGVALLFAMTAATAQTLRTERLEPESTATLMLIEGSITGDEIADYEIGAQQSQILSVDLQSSNTAAYFNILAAGADEALFIGSTAGTVADLPAPATGDYVIRVYMMRSAARRDETADYTLAVSIGEPEYADGLFGGPDYWAVSGVGGGDALNLRAGPSTRYAVIGRLRNGDVLQNRGCRLTGDMRWCQIRAAGSGVTGWVAGRYLTETAPPRRPEMPEGGPVGDGFPFDATGMLPCATSAGQPMRQCLFGVVRDVPGSAGVWIALGDGSERQILFDGGVPVATDAAGALSHEKTGDLTTVRAGDERYEIPDAVIFGG